MLISDLNQLLALFSAMHIAKWELHEDSSHVAVLFASPIFSRLYVALADEIQQTILGRNCKADITSWQTWRSLESHPEKIQRISEHIDKLGAIWVSWSTAQRAEYVRAAASPFDISDVTFALLMR